MPFYNSRLRSQQDMFSPIPRRDPYAQDDQQFLPYQMPNNPDEERRKATRYLPYQVPDVPETQIPLGTQGYPSPRVQSELSGLDFGASDAMDRAAEERGNAASATLNRPRPMLNMDDLNPRPSPLSDRYRNMLSAGPPTRDKQNWMQIAGAALAGFGPGGPKTTMDLLERPYQHKREQYLLNKDALGDAATVERQAEQDRRASVMGKFNIENQRFDNERADAAATRAAANDAMRNKDLQSRMDERDRKARTEGWTPFLDKTDGYRKYSRINAVTGKPEIISVGKMDENLNEQSNRRVSDAANIGAGTLARSKDLNDYRNLTGSQWDLYNENNKNVINQQNADAAEARRAKRPPTANEIYAKRSLVGQQLVESQHLTQSDYDTTTHIAKSKRAKDLIDAVVVRGNVIVEDPNGNLKEISKADLPEALRRRGRIVVQ